jgi:hypothetical protein
VKRAQGTRVYKTETAEMLLFRPRIKRLLASFAELIVLLVETLTDAATTPLNIRTVFLNIGFTRFPHRAPLILRESSCREASDTCDNYDRDSKHETSRQVY